MALKAIIFDWDGVFVDSSELIWRSYNHLYDVGMSSLHFRTKEEFLDFFDTNWLNNAEKMGLDTEEKIDRAIKEFRKHFDKLSHPTEVSEKMIRLVKDLSGRGLLLGIASNIDNSDFILHSILEKNGIDKGIRSIVGYDRTKVLKPDPAGLLMCMKELSVRPEETVFVGDSANDIRAGKNAGVASVIAVAWGFAKREELEKEKPDRIIDSPEELLEAIEHVH